jgi:phosphoglycerate kinase
VLLSADYNVPGDDKGQVTSDYRILNSLPTLEFLLKQNCRIAIISHRGRPEGRPVAEYSLAPVAKRLASLIKKPVAFAADCVGPVAEAAKAALKPGEILVLENTRFHPEEKQNDAAFGRQLAAGADVFVQDAFGNAHRKHASMDAVTKYLPSVAGLLVEKEVTTITSVMEKPARPLMAVIGGAKISDKIGVLDRLIGLADFVVVGGAMANTFLLAQGIEVGKSLVDKDDLPLAREIMEQAHKEAKKRPFVFYLPQDGVAASKIDSAASTRIVDWDAQVIADIQNYPKRPPHKDSHLLTNEMLLDIGPFSGAFIAGGLQLSNTVIWNGTMGVTETPALNDSVGPFAHGTETLVEAMLGKYGHRPFSLVGGGDTVGYVESRQLTKSFDHVSTGGGASLELMSGKKLPGVEALQDK